MCHKQHRKLGMVLSFLVFSCRFGLLLAATGFVRWHRKKSNVARVARPRTLGPNTKRPGQLKRVFKFEEEEVARGGKTNMENSEESSTFSNSGIQWLCNS